MIMKELVDLLQETQTEYPNLTKEEIMRLMALLLEANR